jgi:oxygen-independent coproporphyrinogen-3 oxidase
MNVSNNPGIYIHIPFCQSKCGYCDFYSITDMKFKTPFIQAFKKEIEIHAQNHTSKEPFDTLYIGGGTPSLLLPSEISEIIEKLDKHFPLQTDIEITLEINPGTFEVNTLKFLRSIGINRLSIGIQSFIDQELKFLGRIHTSIQAEECIHFARECGFQNINVDLIYAIPDQDITDWAYSLRKAFLFSPEHIATYNLIFEEGTSFYTSLKRGEYSKLNDAQESKFFEFTHGYLSNAGYHHYEVSNFAKSEETISRHNYKYWNHVNYLGLGPSAHSFWQNKRWSNVKSLNEYLHKINSGKLPIVFREKLNGKNLMFEYIFLKLRTYRGINLNSYQKIFGKNFCHQYQNEIYMLLGDKWAVLDNGYFKLTQKGMRICDEILLHFA